MKYTVKICRSFPSAFTTNGIGYYAKSIINPGKYDRYLWDHSEKCYIVSGIGHTLRDMRIDFMSLMYAHYNFCKRKSITIPIR